MNNTNDMNKVNLNNEEFDDTKCKRGFDWSIPFTGFIFILSLLFILYGSYCTSDYDTEVTATLTNIVYHKNEVIGYTAQGYRVYGPIYTRTPYEAEYTYTYGDESYTYKIYSAIQPAESVRLYVNSNAPEHFIYAHKKISWKELFVPYGK